jgi:hypothetical protein
VYKLKLQGAYEACYFLHCGLIFSYTFLSTNGIKYAFFFSISAQWKKAEANVIRDDGMN